MLNFTETAIRLYRQLFGTPELAGLLSDGIETVLDGNTAVAVTEACISEVAALGGGFLEQGAALAWLSEQQRVTSNLFDQKLSVQQADSARGALASAIGVTLSGHRSTVFLNAQNMASCQDLIQLAVGRRLPQVIHLDNRLFAMQGNSSGSGHETLHQIMDSGCFTLFASNVQEAVDFSLIARQVAEITLSPAIVVIDGAETALAIQDVRLPSRELIKQFIGCIDEKIQSPSIAQQQLFSETRDRLHCWFDLDKPVLQGMMLEPEIAALGNAARKVYFDELIESSLEKAFATFAKLTGRKYSNISAFGLKKADIIFIAQGSAVETTKTLSAFLQDQKNVKDKIKIGVINLSSIRPFNADKLIELLRKNRCTTNQVVVLERMNVPLADDAPLMREIRAAIQKKNVSAQMPKLHSIIYGLAGVSLNFADLWQLCKEIKTNQLKGRYIGIDFNSDSLAAVSTYPKRQVLLDTLQRYYPQINSLGINAKEKLLPMFSARNHRSKQQNKHLNIAISYLTDDNSHTAYAMDLASFLHQLNAQFMRGFISPAWSQWSKRQTDYLMQSDNAYANGSSSLVDFFFVLAVDAQSMFKACQGLNNNGQLLFTDNSFFAPLTATKAEQKIWANCLGLIKQKNLTLYKINAVDNKCFENRDKAVTAEKIQWEKILGIFVGLLQENNQLSVKKRKILSIRQSSLSHFSEDSQNMLAVFFKQTMENIKTFDSKNLIVNSENKHTAATFINPNEAEDNIHIKPLMVESFGQVGSGYDSLPRFWDQVGVLYNSKQLSQLTADPYITAGVIPSLTASFNDISIQNTTLELPQFKSQNCTACGECWVNCPDSAIATVVLTPKALIDSAINSSGADALRQVSSKLASRIAKQLRSTVHKEELAAWKAKDLLIDAFNWLKEKSALTEDRIIAIEADFEKALPVIANLPIVDSDLFFYSQEKQENGSGELFSLTINPEACKACGLCIELCETDALVKSTKQSALISDIDDSSENKHAIATTDVIQYKKLWKIWQQTPDTLSTTIERLIKQQKMPTGAALMLSRHNAFALSGGDSAEAASGEKIAMRQLLSAVEYHQQPLLFRFISEIEQLKDELKQEINHSLSAALPTDNLSLLSERLSDIKTRQVDLNDLLDTNTQIMESSAIDTAKIRTYVDHVLQLNELHWKLSQGIYGIGRSRYSLCLTSNSIASWAGTFPHNPFHVPVNIDVTGESAQIAAGLVHGQVNDLLSAISLKRQAKACIDARYAKEIGKLEQLDWNDLNYEEQQLCPPLFLVGGDDLLGGQGFSQVSQLLNSSYPVKIVIFTELDSGLVSDGLHECKLNSRMDSRNNLAMMAISQRNAYVAQTSIAYNSHLQTSVHDLLNTSTPGLLSIHTPSPSRHAFNPQYCLRQAQLAVSSRMFPLFTYNPQVQGVFGSRISLAANESSASNWVAGENKKALTPVDWALLEGRFQSHFTSLAANVLLPTELLEWIELSALEQKKKTPYVITDEGKTAVSKEFAMMVKNKQQTWQTLQELAGIVTPFTAYVEKCTEERLQPEHQAQLEALRIEYEEKLALLEANYNNATHSKIRNQLLGLAGYNVDRLN
jgi:pyruvate-ferredoxin/flavodoxin oxidoreductase